MRWPLRNQIMFPMIGVMLVTLLAVSALNANLSGRRVKLQIERQLREVTATLSNSNFPLTPAVLRQMSGLTGAEFVVGESPAGLISSLDRIGDLPLQTKPQPPAALRLGPTVQISGQRYFHTVVELRRRGEAPASLHIVYPERSYRDALQQAALPPLAIGAVAVLLVVAFAAAIASRVADPLGRLQRQVGRMADGNFISMPLPDRNDEVRDLSESVNRMADLLSRYEDEVRQSERLRTLGQLGGGIAHQMRNAATGSRLAIEMHQRDCRPEETCDCLAVAKRQLTLMEKQLQRFLRLGKPCAGPLRDIDLAAVVDGCLPFVAPYARHLHVALQWETPDGSFVVAGDPDALEQMFLNLVLNGIEAAAHRDAAARSIGQSDKVVITLARRDAKCIVLTVADTGPGPNDSVRPQLFEPFVSAKPDGTGLGLAVGREVAEQHGGEIRWHRRDKMTCFQVELPAVCVEKTRVEIAGR